jgi:hypothetical protein
MTILWRIEKIIGPQTLTNKGYIRKIRCFLESDNVRG